ncbi:RadC family protein [Thermospira aquatica]|uniref:DNA repair protein RadC n=1 Tax=Thermospira aquatica TaxID=2828656 RepID=A0AAX3BGL3_9SPIR|nr:DNA repair protein RadC [Thermospira aquatica]URA11290.1 DNA repair protein RadC [Thermospira aquatica]
MKTHKPIKTWREEDRPREKLLQRGPEALSTTELLAILIRTGSEGKSALEIASELLEKFSHLRGLDSASLGDLCRIHGIGQAKAIEIKACLELGKRLMREEVKKPPKISSAQEAINYVQQYYGPVLRDARQEVFSIILLDIRNKPLHHLEISRGSAYATVVDPREVVRQICLHQASGVILVHNHPSGECTPSQDDQNLTKRLASACEMVGARVIDHIIIGKNPSDYYSFAIEGHL